MKSDIIVIIACDRLCKDFCHLKQLEYKNGNKLGFVDLYACGADDKDAIADFIETLMDKYEYTAEHKERVKNFLNFLKNAAFSPISEYLHMLIARQMHQIKSDSWKYMTDLMSENRYLVMGEDEGFLLPKDIDDINFVLNTLALPPFQV